ncbi:MAG TPA: glucoamylase family protein [Terriglobales bacterium]|nr:glucoamylase family protein [Terriglobales bacterium]
MPQNTHLELVTAEAERVPETAHETAPDTQSTRAHATELARGLAWLPGTQSSDVLFDRSQRVKHAIRKMLRMLGSTAKATTVSDDFHWIQDNVRLVQSELETTSNELARVRKPPHVRNRSYDVVPRALAVAEGFCTYVEYQFDEQAFLAYLEAFQESTILNYGELWAVVPALKLLLLEQIAVRGTQVVKNPSGTYGAGVCVRSLRDVSQTAWRTVLEPMIRIDRVLRDDPAGAYPRMDYESRDLYRRKIVNLAEHSDFSEMEVTAAALALARDAQKQSYPDPRILLRRSHIGYYLLAEGAAALRQRIGFRAPFGQRFQLFMRRHPDEVYLPGIELLTLIVILGILLPLIGPSTSLGLMLLSVFVLLLPCSQAAVQIMNYVTTAILTPQIIPKLDFSNDIPDDCATLVAVPALLLNEPQIRRLVHDVEVRYLGNHSRNIHYALLTDLPDSRETPTEDDPRIQLCGELIKRLNQKYATRQAGRFLLLHRHRVYNPRERVWMGWERKRGKLLDLNRLLRKQYDSFPVKVGDLSVLSQVRFVITLDADTELPRGAAQRMIGALAHPLNQAIIEPEKNIVVAGYGILQPRLGVSVQSAAKSRLASIYSGETGFDIYTRAVSDVYQDLYGEGSFTGKGIYEVDTLHRVLDRRFPRNALLSHDLIEGAYARAGLVSDVEIIEDYPSHYSAYNRRKHRWLRGDWQIAGWLSSKVPDEAGNRVPNPISIVSQWKILDNLRRSLVEPAFFLLLVLGWLVLPGRPLRWTVVTLGILFLPPYFQFVFNLVRAAAERKLRIAQAAVHGLFADNVNVFLTLTFLAHQTLISIDAVVRAQVRRIITQRRLLEWETAAEAELAIKRETPVDRYLNWTPALALVLAAWVALQRPRALPAALAILVLWGASKLLSLWLNEPPRPQRNEASEKDQLFLRRAALRTWRYFAEFSNEEHNWLVPDNVQEDPPAVAARISPTNLGLLLNARQVACQFGYVTVPEFTYLTLRTLDTISRLPRYRGHLYNWYDTKTLAPLPPLFVSSVDSGNLVASLWTLQAGCLERLHLPVVQDHLAEGLLDYFEALADMRAFQRKSLRALRRVMRRERSVPRLLDLFEKALNHVRDVSSTKHAKDVEWFAGQARARLLMMREAVRVYTPWMLPEFSALREDDVINLRAHWYHVPLDRTPEFIETLATRLQRISAHANGSGDRSGLVQRLLELLADSRRHVIRLMDDLRRVAAAAAKLAEEMDFAFLLNQRRKLLSAGFDADRGELHPACYDLLASESRTAVFVAVAKDDIPQESWFLLGRTHTTDHGQPVLLSWTGTMFEYMMPALWMRSFPNTLLERSRSAAVRSQQEYPGKRIPWGISESAYAKRDEAGNYQYHAFGIPQLALRHGGLNGIVISPYSTFLALQVEAAGALANLRRMAHKGWFGPYGFYESADFMPSARRSWRHRYELIHCWMAHHQGMILLSLANFLYDGIVQEWFHSDPRVQATELLLHEKPVSHARILRDYSAVA